MKDIPLGKKVSQTKGHDPSILYPIPRKRIHSLVNGYDLWRAYELSWLDRQGKPQIGILEIIYPVQSKNIVESKSLKLYLGGLSYEKFDSEKTLEETIHKDIGQVLATPWLSARIIMPEDFNLIKNESITGVCIDNLGVDIDNYQLSSDLLSCGQTTIEETIYTDLLRTNCPITGQPDWASVYISYRGKAITHESLLRYICSYRDYEGFAEEICEQIYSDIMEKCSPEMLGISCFYTRRGGIDINPTRCTKPVEMNNIRRIRLIRQ